MEVEQFRILETTGGELPCQEFLRILAEVLANSVAQDLGGSVPN